MLNCNKVTCDHILLLYTNVTGHLLDVGHEIRDNILQTLQGSTTGGLKLATIITDRVVSSCGSTFDDP